jgi:hypothetical protein
MHSIHREIFSAMRDLSIRRAGSKNFSGNRSLWLSFVSLHGAASKTVALAYTGKGEHIPSMVHRLIAERIVDAVSRAFGHTALASQAESQFRGCPNQTWRSMREIDVSHYLSRAMINALTNCSRLFLLTERPPPPVPLLVCHNYGEVLLESLEG